MCAFRLGQHEVGTHEGANPTRQAGTSASSTTPRSLGSPSDTIAMVSLIIICPWGWVLLLAVCLLAAGSPLSLLWAYLA